MKPWINPQMYDYANKQKKRKEELKHIAADALGVLSNKVSVKNAFEDELLKMGMTKEQLDSLKE